MPTSLRDWCRRAVGTYLARFPAEVDRLADLRDLLATDLPLHDRRTLPGHVTASGVVVDAAAGRVLLIRHRALGRWLPPGGHVEAGELPPAAARREVAEEVGLAVGPVLSWRADAPLPIDIDSHPIPANDRRGEPAHVHHDFRFRFAGDSTAALAGDPGEVSAAEWVPVDDARVPADLRATLGKLATADLVPVTG